MMSNNNKNIYFKGLFMTETSCNKPPLIVGNWKMNKTAMEAVNFIQELAPRITGIEADVYLSVQLSARKI